MQTIPALTRFLVTPRRERLTHVFKFEVYQASLYGETTVKSNLYPSVKPRLHNQVTMTLSG
ncbi:hypothetical protein AVEN_156646-1, partial [Araneus ventricosus]